MLPVVCGIIAGLLAATQEVTTPTVDPAAPPAVHVTIEATLPYFSLYLAHPGQLIGTTREGEETLELEFPWPLEHVLLFDATAPGYELGRYMMD